jgi:hypothetical protein
MKKLLLIGMLFFCGCEEEIKREEVRPDYSKPTYLKTIDGKELYFMQIHPYGNSYTVDRIYFFKDSNTIITEQIQASGKNSHYKTVIIDGSPYKRQDVPNE